VWGSRIVERLDGATGPADTSGQWHPPRKETLSMDTKMVDETAENELAIDDVDDAVFELDEITEADFNVLTAVRIY
jgi:hypothetical protein